MKNKRFLKIFSLFLMLGLVFGIGISSYAYSYDDSTGNLNSDNLAQPFYTDSTQYLADVTCNFNNEGVLTMNGTSTGTGSLWLCKDISITESGTYYFEIFNALNQGNSTFVRLDNNSTTALALIRGSSTGVSINLETGTFSALLWVGSTDQTYNNLIIKPMLIKGNNAPSLFEPYGVEWYSSENYNTYGQEMYNNGVASVTTMFSSCDSIQMTLGSNSAVTYDDWEEWYTAYLWESGSTTGFYRVQDGGLYFYWNRYVSGGYGSIGDTVKIVFTWNYGNYPSTSQYNYYYIEAYQGSSIAINSPNAYALYTTTSSLSLPTDSNTAISSIVVNFVQVGVGTYYAKLVTTNDTLNAYNNGYDNGYETGYNKGYDEGYESGEDIGSAEGYNEGITDNVTTNGFKTLFNSILSYPINMIKTVFNFEFMGINIAGLITFIISIGIVAFLIAHFRKK